MPQMNARRFVPTKNTQLLNAIRKDASPEYRARIPEATDATIDKTLNELFRFPGMRNEFVDALVNRIGLEIVRYKSWTNPFGKFKRGMLEYGSTIEEVQIGLVKAHVYDPEREYLERDVWGNEIVDVQSNFHTINRQNFYKITINDVILKRAFLEEYGLSNFIQGLMDAPRNSDQVDEYQLMTGLFRKHYDRDGFFKQNVADVSALGSDSEAAKTALRRVRAMAGNLGFISTHYNPAGMPTFAERDDLELIVTPEFSAAVDVEALAGAFNTERAMMPGRQTEIRVQDMNIPGAQAILTTKDFFVVADTLFETRNAVNPAGLTQNYFLHHHQIVSLSRFAPAVLFTSTEQDTPIVINPTNLTGISDVTISEVPGGAVVDATDVPRNSYYQVNVTPVTSPENEPYALTLSLDGAEGQFTKITQDGLLFIGVDETADMLTVKVSDPKPGSSVAAKTLTLTLSGDVAQIWPNPKVIEDADAGE